MTNAKQASPAIVVDLDRKRNFVLDLNAFCELEKRVGKSLFKLIKWDDMGVNDLRYLLWAGLLTDDPSLTLEDFSKMVSMQKLQQFAPMINEMLGRTMPPAEPAKEGDAEKKEQPTA